MKKVVGALALSILSVNSWAVKLADYKPFQFETLFTNPVCATYAYDKAVVSVGGKNLNSKPDDVYCKPSDEDTSVNRANAPQRRLIEWISSPETKEILTAYLSFSSKNIATALCDAAKRGVKIDMVIDGGEDHTTSKDAEALKSCSSAVKVTYRGNTGGMGYAHNKIMLINPKDKVVKMVFSSGNLTSGTSINHENWNFITTASESFFIQSHICVVNSMITAGDSRVNFTAALNGCRDQIKAPKETDIQVFFSPVEGKAALDKVTEAGHNAVMVEAMSHRFSGALADLFKDLLASHKEIKFILDDDIYWANLLKKDVGRNTKFEAFKIYNELITKGMNTRFMQTNQNVFQLQHNKFMIFTFADKSGAVFNGAGNFTSAAFTKNFENFYYITIPSVVENYRKQYKKYFDEMATAPDDMPRDYVLP
jgi:phosphatidylserine/phosphatidylglycerophosphate/cardiolipin synthase-like enzyme